MDSSLTQRVTLRQIQSLRKDSIQKGLKRLHLYVHGVFDG